MFLRLRLHLFVCIDEVKTNQRLCQTYMNDKCALLCCRMLFMQFIHVTFRCNIILWPSSNGKIWNTCTHRSASVTARSLDLSLEIVFYFYFRFIFLLNCSCRVSKRCARTGSFLNQRHRFHVLSPKIRLRCLFKQTMHFRPK